MQRKTTHFSTILPTILLVAAILTSCSTTNTFKETEKLIMDSWLGKTKSDLITAWGNPIRVEDYGNQGEILVYEFEDNATMDRYRVQYNQRSYRVRMFYVNPSGIIYEWKTATREFEKEAPYP